MIVCFIHFHHVHSVFLVYVRHFLNHTIVFWRPLWPSALGSRLVRLMVAPAFGSVYSISLGKVSLQLCRPTTSFLWHYFFAHGTFTCIESTFSYRTKNFLSHAHLAPARITLRVLAPTP